MRRFVIVGSKATASPDFRLDDIPSSSGRLDVLLRGLRAGLLVSHGLRADSVVYLVLQGDPTNIVTLRFDGAAARFIRPDDRSLATLIQKVLKAGCEGEGAAFTTVRAGIAMARGGIDCVMADADGATGCLLDEAGADLRSVAHELDDSVFFLGDHVGLDPATRERLARAAPHTLSVGPVSLHTEDVIAIVHNELDRRQLAGSR